MSIENDTVLAAKVNPETGRKWAFTSGKGWFEVPLAPHERTTQKPSLLERAGKGVDDIVSGIKQGILYHTDPEEYGRYTKEKDQENAYYDKALNEHGVDGIDWPRLGGQVGMTSPVGIIPSGTRTGSQLALGALQGGIAGGAMYTPEGQSKLLQTGMGAVGGGLGNVAANKMIDAAGVLTSKAANAFNSIKSKIFPEESIVVRLNNAGIDVDSAPVDVRQSIINDAREQLRLTGKLDAEALQRKTKAEGLGFTGDYAPTTGQATRDPTLWARERNLAKTEDGLPILSRLKNQNKRLTEELRDEMPISQIMGDDVGESIFAVTNRKWREMQEQVGALYKQADEEFEGYAMQGMPRFEERLIEMSDDATATPIIQSVLNRGNRIGLFGDEVKDVSIKNVEQFRKFINNLSDKNEPALMRLKKEIIDQLDDEVIDGLGSDAYSLARDKARQRFQEFETKLVRGIVDGKETPDKIFKRVLNAPRKDLEALKYSLNKSHIDGEDAIGVDTWNAIRASTIDWIWDQATAGMRGEGQFSGTMFKKALDKLGDKKLRILFDADEVGKLYDISETGLNLTREPTFSAVNYSNTTPAMYNMLSRVPHVGEMLQNAAKQGAVEANVTRSLSSSPAIQLTPEEVLTNMRGMLDVHPVLRGLLKAPAWQSTTPAVLGQGLLPKSSGQ